MKLSRKFRNFSTIFSLVVLMGFSLTKVWQSVTNLEALGEADKFGREFVLVDRVVDGDTIELSDGRKVRYIGIDTPETKDPRKEVQCFGEEASAYNQDLVEGKVVAIEADVVDKDRYDRLLRYVWLEDEMINKKLVAEGYAYASSYPPNVKYQTQFKLAQQQAREQNLGLWAECMVNDTALINQAIDRADRELLEDVQHKINQVLGTDFSF